VTAPEPTVLPRLLRDNPDTVTHLLEELLGEPLVADVVRRYSMPAEAGNALGVAAGRPVTHRIAVLRGGATTVPFVYAESAFVPERLPDAARLQLERTSDPIGRVLAVHGLAHAREEISSDGPGRPQAMDRVAAGAAPIVWWRAYRLTIDDLPVFAIREWFFRTVQDAVERQSPA
jgi:chorismate-pyruvate lyase